MGERAVADELAIGRVLHAYCQLLEDGDFAALADQFAPQGSYSYAGEVVTGRTALQEWFAEHNPPERRGKHLTVNAIVDVRGDQAEVTSDFLFIRVVDGAVTPVFAGRYFDVLTRTEGRWVIESRVIDLLRSGD
jgi:hypothetical protein